MLKSILTLLRGRAFEADEAFVDRNALAILRQQLRECAQAVSAARKALAIAIAQNEQEQVQYHKLVDRIADLEDRAVSALEQGRDDLAREAAETIAHLQTERAGSEDTQSEISAELARLRKSVETSEHRLRALKRGQRIAAATDQTQRLTVSIPQGTDNSLRDAEETLTRLRTRQTQMDAANAALDEMERSNDPKTLREKLAAAGCGAPLKTTAEAVLARRGQRVAKPA